MTRTGGQPRRRNNAPIRPPRRAPMLPDLLFFVSATAWVMAATFLASTFSSSDSIAGQAGRALAELFSFTLIATGVFLFLVGLILLRDDRSRIDHYVTPILLGVVAGAIEAVLFLNPAGPWLLAPLVLIIFAVRPVRARLVHTFRPLARR